MFNLTDSHWRFLDWLISNPRRYTASIEDINDEIARLLSDWSRGPVPPDPEEPTTPRLPALRPWSNPPLYRPSLAGLEELIRSLVPTGPMVSVEPLVPVTPMVATTPAIPLGHLPELPRPLPLLAFPVWRAPRLPW